MIVFAISLTHVLVYLFPTSPFCIQIWICEIMMAILLFTTLLRVMQSKPSPVYFNVEPTLPLLTTNKMDPFIWQLNSIAWKFWRYCSLILWRTCMHSFLTLVLWGHWTVHDNKSLMERRWDPGLELAFCYFVIFPKWFWNVNWHSCEILFNAAQTGDGEEQGTRRHIPQRKAWKDSSSCRR